MAEIQLKAITKIFKDIEVLKNLNLTVKDGEFFTVIGPSGCGKSTLLNIIAGLEMPTKGEIYFDGKLVNELTPKDRDVAMVFQSYALYPHMNVYENIAFPLKMRKINKKKIKQEVEKVAKILGLENLLHRKPKQLSGGQRQRVALGRAIVRKPKVFLMDEPLSNLDAKLRLQMRTELKRLHKQINTTIVYVTHDQAEAMGLSDRIAILNNGSILQCDTPFELYRKPINTFVAGFIGYPTMNIVEAEIISKEPPIITIGKIKLMPNIKKLPDTKKVLLGIRPEDLIITKENATHNAKVDLVEPEGSKVWVDVLVDGIKLKAISSFQQSLKPKDKVFINVLPENIHVFDFKSGERF